MRRRFRKRADLTDEVLDSIYIDSEGMYHVNKAKFREWIINQPRVKQLIDEYYKYRIDITEYTRELGLSSGCLQFRGPVLYQINVPEDEIFNEIMNRVDVEWLLETGKYDSLESIETEVKELMNKYMTYPVEHFWYVLEDDIHFYEEDLNSVLEYLEVRKIYMNGREGILTVCLTGLADDDFDEDKLILDAEDLWGYIHSYWVKKQIHLKQFIEGDFDSIIDDVLNFYGFKLMREYIRRVKDVRRLIEWVEELEEDVIERWETIDAYEDEGFIDFLVHIIRDWE